MHLAAIIFAITYLLISLGENSPRKLDRPTATLLGAVLMIMTGALTRTEAVRSLDLSTLAVLFGMMVLLAVLMQSRLPSWLALKAIHHCSNQHRLLAVVVFTSGISSALLLNDTVCLLGTPLLLEITERAAIPATPFLLALATSANIGSVMTLTGNPQNIIIGHYSGWSWSGFALRMVPIGLICLVVNWLILELIYHRSLTTATLNCQNIALHHETVQKKLAFKSVCVFIGLIVAFLVGAPMDFAAVSAATILLVWANRPPKLALKAIDWSLLLFFAGLFIVVEGFVKDTQDILNLWITHLGTQVHLKSIMQISFSSVLGSNIFSNVPFVLIVAHWVKQMNEPRFVWLLLALTSTFAGNLTLFGSVANVIVAQGAQQKSPLRFTDFLKAGIPITIATVIIGVLLLWIFFIIGWI
jgi:Na+/H+ antiporter NhaD/arsenite permease-like protein